MKKLPLPLEGAEAEAAKKKFPQRHATGYSSRVSFEDAFRNAIAQLPPRFPDELQQFVVTDTGALVGGVAGIQELYVTVRVD